ncbi:MAG: hypothetical protein KBA23_10765 [Amaricoccus sp.]|nr:hypothetical protein [Amaricoccus sp.]
MESPMDLSSPELGEGSGSPRCIWFSPSPPTPASRQRLVIEDDREAHRVACPLAEILLLAVCGTIADSPIGASATWGSCGGSRPTDMAFRRDGG